MKIEKHKDSVKIINNGEEWVVYQAFYGDVGSLYYTKNDKMVVCTATIAERLTTQELEDNLIKFVEEQDPIARACEEIMQEDKQCKELIERIINSKSKIKTSNFQGKNSMQSYLNGKVQREQEIIDIINEYFEEG